MLLRPRITPTRTAPSGLSASKTTKAKAVHPFRVVKNLFRHCKARYRGLAKKMAQLLTLFGLAKWVLARRGLLPAHAQSTS